MIVNQKVSFSEYSLASRYVIGIRNQNVFIGKNMTVITVINSNVVNVQTTTR